MNSSRKQNLQGGSGGRGGIQRGGSRGFQTKTKR